MNDNYETSLKNRFSILESEYRAQLEKGDDANMGDIQKLSESAGILFYDAYWYNGGNVGIDDISYDCLDLYRDCRRLIPERAGARFMKRGKRPGSWEAYITTQEGYKVPQEA